MLESYKPNYIIYIYAKFKNVTAENVVIKSIKKTGGPIMISFKGDDVNIPIKAKSHLTVTLSFQAPAMSGMYEIELKTYNEKDEEMSKPIPIKFVVE